MIFSTLLLSVDTANKETNIANRTENLLKIPTGWRPISWLLTRSGAVEFGTTKHIYSSSSQGFR